jgi:hypothetical protein
VVRAAVHHDLANGELKMQTKANIRRMILIAALVFVLAVFLTACGKGPPPGGSSMSRRSSRHDPCCNRCIVLGADGQETRLAPAPPAFTGLRKTDGPSLLRGAVPLVVGQLQ